MHVALESTVISHGLPRPQNLEAALACEQAVRDTGAQPATVALVAGRPTVGMSDGELRELAERNDVAKVSLHNLAVVAARGQWGATTVAATLHLASRTGIRVFATGGIGGVHRGAERDFDVSSDLTALGSTPMIVVSAGAKSILDLPRTVEVLETLGVPVIGFGTDELPAFYARTSGLAVTARADTPEEVAVIASTHWALGRRSAVLVVVPCPEHAAIPAAEVDRIVDAAVEDAAAEGITGPRVTPFLLSRIAARTGGRALAANLALLENNARVAGRIAMALADIG